MSGRWSAAEVEALQRLAPSTIYAEIAAQLPGRSDVAVTRKINALGLHPDPHRTRLWNVTETDELVRLYDLGFRLSEIASRIGRSEGSVKGKIWSLGSRGARLRQWFWTAAQDADLCRRRSEGESFSAIAAALGRSKNAVAGRAFRLGLCEVAWEPPPRAEVRFPERDECRYPLSETPLGAVTGWCCAPVVPGTSWCAAHKSSCLVPPPPEVL